MENKIITLKEPDLGRWSDVKEISIGKNVDGYGSDITIEFNDGSAEGYSFINNGE